VRSEWVNIGILLFDPRTGERRFRLIDQEEEFRHVRRLHPQMHEAPLRQLSEELHERFEAELARLSPGAQDSSGGRGTWDQVLSKWDATLSTTIQLAPAKGSFGLDMDSEINRLYDGHVAVTAPARRTGIS